MNLLKDEIEKCKREWQDTNAGVGKSKYIRRGEIKEYCSPKPLETQDISITKQENEPNQDRITDTSELTQKDNLLLDQKVPKIDTLNKIYQIPSIQTDPITIELYRSDPSKAASLVLLYLKRLLVEWYNFLENRSKDQKNTIQGKIATNIHREACEYIKPLFQRLKHETISKDVLKHIVQICHYMQLCEYIQANDVYLQLAIGNAPWPIGVTMVGIHERSAREKISSNQVAHVLNDESQRKWIQSLKRIMTFCQIKYPPNGPSKAMG